MDKKSYKAPALEVVEIGLGALQCASPQVQPPAGISNHDDWVTDSHSDNEYDI